jgi:RNA polymerase sigma-70 factor (ECF subfamily)
MAFRSDISDFGAFYERTYAGAYRTALGIVRDPSLADDVTQEAFVAAYAARDRFRGDAPGYAWLHRIVVNHALSALRKGHRIVREIAPNDLPQFDDTHPGDTDRLALLEALGRLSPRQRAAIVLRYYHDYDYATIAHIMDTTSTNVGALLSRALDRLRDQLEKEPAAMAAGGRA